MSTSYRTLSDIQFSSLFGGALEPFNVREQVTDLTTPSERCLTDGNNFLWVYRGSSGEVDFLKRWGWNTPQKILAAICEAFDVEIVSEYEPEYFGFATQEEWDACMEKLAAKDRDRLYEQVMCYVRGEEHGLSPGTIGMIQADIAKVLIGVDPNLALPENKQRLLDAMQSTYYREHAVTVTLTPEDLALARLIGTHEDDLPKG